MSIIERSLRYLLSGSFAPLILRPHTGPGLPFTKPTGLYLHIPLCTNCCSFCPYVREKFTSWKAELLRNAVVKEIDLFASRSPKTTWTSLYIGGGSPLLMGESLCTLVEGFRNKLGFSGPVAVEAYPGDVNDRGIDILNRCGATMVSLGAQSFDAATLAFLGRNHSADQTRNALKRLAREGYNTINVDLLFAIKGQTWTSVQNDLTIARDFGATQITCYPLFTFPFTEIGRYLKLKSVRLPPNSLRKQLYYRIHQWCLDNGFKRTSVWSFSKPSHTPFSSVTREHFAGFGPSAGSFNGTQFAFNTFELNAYAEYLENGKPPLALSMTVSPIIERLFYVYWRFYQTRVDFIRYRDIFGRDFRTDFSIPISILKWVGWVTEDRNGELELTMEGSHWLHLLQNHVALDYTSTIWEKMKQCAWPGSIEL